MIGEPKFNYGDLVKFKVLTDQSEDEVELVGTIEIIDRYGTFYNNSDVHYDVMTEINGQRCLVKHLIESSVSAANEVEAEAEIIDDVEDDIEEESFIEDYNEVFALDDEEEDN